MIDKTEDIQKECEERVWNTEGQAQSRVMSDGWEEENGGVVSRRRLELQPVSCPTTPGH